ncbi:hypothetical protein DICA2_F02300 [Diutina catenulata]
MAPQDKAPKRAHDDSNGGTTKKAKVDEPEDDSFYKFDSENASEDEFGDEEDDDEDDEYDHPSVKALVEIVPSIMVLLQGNKKCVVGGLESFCARMADIPVDADLVGLARLDLMDDILKAFCDNEDPQVEQAALETVYQLAKYQDTSDMGEWITPEVVSKLQTLIASDDNKTRNKAVATLAYFLEWYNTHEHPIPVALGFAKDPDYIQKVVDDASNAETIELVQLLAQVGQLGGDPKTVIEAVFANFKPNGREGHAANDAVLGALAHLWSRDELEEAIATDSVYKRIADGLNARGASSEAVSLLRRITSRRSKPVQKGLKNSTVLSTLRQWLAGKDKKKRCAAAEVYRSMTGGWGSEEGFAVGLVDDVKSAMKFDPEKDPESYEELSWCVSNLCDDGHTHPKRIERLAELELLPMVIDLVVMLAEDEDSDEVYLADLEAALDSVLSVAKVRASSDKVQQAVSDDDSKRLLETVSEFKDHENEALSKLAKEIIKTLKD